VTSSLFFFIVLRDPLDRRGLIPFTPISTSIYDLLDQNDNGSYSP